MKKGQQKQDPLMSLNFEKRLLKSKNKKANLSIALKVFVLIIKFVSTETDFEDDY